MKQKGKSRVIKAAQGIAFLRSLSRSVLLPRGLVFMPHRFARASSKNSASGQHDIIPDVEHTLRHTSVVAALVRMLSFGPQLYIHD